MKNLARKLALVALIPAFTVSTSASAFKGTVATARLHNSVAIVAVHNATDSMLCLVLGPATPATAGMIAMAATAKVSGKLADVYCDPTSLLLGVQIND